MILPVALVFQAVAVAVQEPPVPALPAIQTVEVVRGAGPMAKSGDRVTIHYHVTVGGKVIADSKRAGMTYTYVVGSGQAPMFIDSGVLGLQKSGGRTYTVTPSLQDAKLFGLTSVPTPQFSVRLRVVDLVRPAASTPTE